MKSARIRWMRILAVSVTSLTGNLSSVTDQSLHLPSNVGLSSALLCQHRGIHFVANDTNSAGPFIASNGGRLLRYATAAFICSSLIAVKNIHLVKICITCLHSGMNETCNIHIAILSVCQLGYYIKTAQRVSYDTGENNNCTIMGE